MEVVRVALRIIPKSTSGPRRYNKSSFPLKLIRMDPLGVFQPLAVMPQKFQQAGDELNMRLFLVDDFC